MTQDLPTLFTSPGSYALAVDIALRWAGADYSLQVLHQVQDRELIDSSADACFQVPAIKLDGQSLLTGVQALLLLVADSHPERDLAPSSSQPLERYRLEQLLAFMTGDVLCALALDSELGWSVSREERASGLRLRALDEARPLLARLDARLGAKSFLLGKRTVADPILYVLTRWAKAFQDDLATMPNLSRFRTEMEADRAVAASLEAHGIEPAGG